MPTPLGHGTGTRVDTRAGEKFATGQNIGKGGSMIVVCEVVGEKTRALLKTSIFLTGTLVTLLVTVSNC